MPFTMGLKTKLFLVAFLVLLTGIGAWFLLKPEPAPSVVEEPEPVVEEPEAPVVEREVIGTSVEGREIEVVRYGDGEIELLFVGGVHGGYEWNSVLLAYQFIDYLSENPDIVPEGLTVSIIPDLNPDGLFKVVGKEGPFELADVPSGVPTAPGRFNANQVDLNRNFGCKWAPESTWRGEVVSAGTEAFSEPEAAALRDYVLTNEPRAAIFWHSKSNAVYGSECAEGVLPETLDIMNVYAEAADYGAVPVFDAYPITGDAEGWLASIGIPAITVELETHETVEWERNLSGWQALIGYYVDGEVLAR